MARPINFWISPEGSESSEKRVARFKQWFTRSRIGDTVKLKRYNKRSLTKRLVRQAALVRESFRTERERSKFYQ